MLGNGESVNYALRCSKQARKKLAGPVFFVLI